MWISSINLRNFRCFKSLSFTSSQDLNILMGENNVGKSTVFIAVSKLNSAIWEDHLGVFNIKDIRYNNLDEYPLSASCNFTLDLNNRRDIINLLSPTDFDLNTKRILIKRLGNTLDTLQLGFEWSNTIQYSYMKLGPLYVTKNCLSYDINYSGTTKNVTELMRLLVSSDYAQNLDEVMHTAEVWKLNSIRENILAILKPNFSHFSEFRGRPIRASRTASMSSLEGSQTANVLLNLKNHTEKRQRRRYKAVQYAFSTFLPQLRIEAVETGPGSGVADIQFTEVGANYSVPIENVGAGIAELLTLLANLVTLSGYTFVIEEPELHLHPHAKRSLAELIRHSSIHNQVFIITHDPLFINPDFILNLNRFYLKGKKSGTVVASMSKDLSARDIGQAKTASKDVAKRELFFARAVLFVEDESQKYFIEGCANKLDYGLDSLGLSIIEVGGEDGFEPYIKLAKQLDIPFLCLSDLPWGSSPDRPPTIYRSLGYELEQYLEDSGCGSLMEQAKKAIGSSKQRVAKYCGEHIEVANIPPFFPQLLDDAMKLCKKRYRKK